ncbi:hypothetical protein [Spirosoma sordidisoli]|uniref:Conjugative transposon TraJ C-terminal domain-containing protein n=1 Tax=Spirosoma sordidisoli TaxID=2502893 RepID=A0A4Q2UIC4_9BACT|nr:hypothetical protein [Spirosoma sordidisoli]RYC66499.1 hypothetical protein EQG79_29450 [Spirosoma sordidisoli]
MLATILLQAPVVSSVEVATEQLMTTMRPHFSDFISLGQAIGGTGAICYVFARIWQGMLSPPIAIYPLLRPFALALALIGYPFIVDGLTGIGQALDGGTATLVNDSRQQVKVLNAQKDALLKKKWEQTNTEIMTGEGSDWLATAQKIIPGVALGRLAANAMQYGMSVWFDEMIRWVSEMLYTAAATGLKVIQTFFLLILFIVGPLTFGLACFDWFFGSLATWFARVIHVILWIPVANIFGGIIEQVHITMLKIDIAQLQNTAPEATVGTDFTMIVFYVIGTVGYLLVPKVTGWILESAGVGSGAGSAIQPIASAANTGSAASGAVIGNISGRFQRAIR